MRKTNNETSTPSRYLFFYDGDALTPEADVRLIGKKATIIDRSTKMLLVEISRPAIKDELLHDLPDWSVKPEKMHTVPSTRPILRKRL